MDATLDGLCADLHRLWLIFDRDLRQGKLKHLEYDPGRKTLSWRTPKVDKEEALQAAFYARLPARGRGGVASQPAGARGGVRRAVRTG